MEDALLAQLLGMGFGSEELDACHRELSAQGSYSLQTATNWLLRQQEPSTTSATSSRLVLSPSAAGVPERKPMSSGSDFSSHTQDQPLKTRHFLSDGHRDEKERFANKEREEMLKNARMQKMADIRAKQLIKKQIEDDRKAKLEKLKSAKPSSPRPLQEATTKSCDSQVTSTGCRVQVRLPSGRVLRQNFLPSQSLSHVIEFVREKCPEISDLHLAQTYPHHQFTESEHSKTLAELNLTPSASLVVPRAPQPALPMDTTAADVSRGNSGSTGARDEGPLLSPRGQRLVDDSDEEMELADNDGEVGGAPMAGGRGHRLGDGREDEAMDQDDQPHPPVGGPLLPNAPIVIQHVFPDVEDPERYRVGGRQPVVVGDLQQQSRNMREAARSAAIQRSLAPPTSHTSSGLHFSPPSLEALTTRTLLALSTSFGLPSCSGLTPMAAQRLIQALKKEKRLNTKTLTAFHGCPLNVLEIDNYIFTTNELLQSLCHFPSLRQLSLSSCPIITDRAISALLPYLSGLTLLNLNGCPQVDEVVCRAIKRCSNLEVLKLSELKITDRGLSLLLATPLPRLSVLDLSRTLITNKGMEVLPQGAPNLESLNIEGTKVSNFSCLSQLPALTSVNVSHCPSDSDVGTLSSCHGIKALSTTGIKVSGAALQKLGANLRLESFKLPDRNFFFDDHLQWISGFPLSSLSLMDYCHVTDAGISHVSHMTTLQSLTLSRTKLTDQGMPFLSGLVNLVVLSIDNTLVTNDGMISLSPLKRLEVLSLSDTKVGDGFILNGCLDPLGTLSKLNLTRTAITDRGLLRLQLPSLVMLKVDWTSVSDGITVEALIEGCPMLEVLSNSNINQPLPGLPARDQD